MKKSASNSPVEQHPSIANHRRVNQILLGSLERPALKWLAAHLPAWVTPDHMTILGTLGALVIAGSYWATRIDPNFLWLASLGFVINWFGDSLDGSLARYRHIERPRYGFFVDHTVDAINESLVFLGLGLSPYVRLDIAALALSGYLLMSVLVYVRTLVNGEFRISYGGMGPTEVRVIAILANTIIFFSHNPSYQTPLGVFSLYDLIGIAIALLLYAVFIVSTYNQSRQLSNVDRTPVSNQWTSGAPTSAGRKREKPRARKSPR